MHLGTEIRADAPFVGNPQHVIHQITDFVMSIGKQQQVGNHILIIYEKFGGKK